MPHCIIEYAKTLETKVGIANLVDKVFRGALKSALFDANDIKTRAMGYDYFQVADRTDEAEFIHVNVKLLAGRDKSVKRHLSESILNEILTLNMTKVSVSVKVKDLDTECYAKEVLC